MKRSVGMVGLCAGLLLTAAACGEDRDDGAGGSAATSPTGTDAPIETTAEVTYPPNGVVEEILSLDNNFILQTVEVEAGTEILWVNNGRNDHNIIPEGDPELTAYGVLQDGFHPGDTYSHVFTEPGTYVYYCSIHGTATAGMFGTIIVTEP